MKKELVYVIGFPGAGKTTLMNRVLGDVGWVQLHQPIPHVLYPGGIEIGVKRPIFGGTDGLSMSIQERALAFIRDCPYDAIIAEGDRLANAPFFNAVRQWVSLTVYLVDVPEEVAAIRRKYRGSNQNPSWIKGRVKKVYNLAPYVTFKLDGQEPLDRLATLLMADPVISRIKEKRIIHAPKN